jgi:hypothetical protein
LLIVFGLLTENGKLKTENGLLNGKRQTVFIYLLLKADR